MISPSVGRSADSTPMTLDSVRRSCSCRYRKQFEFRRGRSDEEDRVGALEHARHLFEEMLRVARMLFRLAVSLRVAVDVLLGCEDGGFLRRVRVHVEDARFAMIDPGDGVCRHEPML